MFRRAAGGWLSDTHNASPGLTIRQMERADQSCGRLKTERSERASILRGRSIGKRAAQSGGKRHRRVKNPLR